MSFQPFIMRVQVRIEKNPIQEEEAITLVTCKAGKGKHNTLFKNTVVNSKESQKT